MSLKKIQTHDRGVKNVNSAKPHAENDRKSGNRSKPPETMPLTSEIITIAQPNVDLPQVNLISRVMKARTRQSREGEIERLS